MRRRGSCAKTQVGANAGVETCTSCAVDHGVVWGVACGTASREADPWVARWVADLRELEPFDERGVIQRMGIDVRALWLNRELATDFIAMEVTRLQSLAVQVPPWGFQEVAGRSAELSEKGVPQWRCLFETECEASFGSFKALATHVLRHHRQMETVSRLVVTNQCPACRRGSSSLPRPGNTPARASTVVAEGDPEARPGPARTDLSREKHRSY